MPKKQIEIHDSYYYDGHRKKWKIENIANVPVELPSEKSVRKWLDNWDRTESYDKTGDYIMKALEYYHRHQERQKDRDAR